MFYIFTDAYGGGLTVDCSPIVCEFSIAINVECSIFRRMSEFLPYRRWRFV